ncbi:MAG: DinB family protein [Bacteroidota bacterium]
MQRKTIDTEEYNPYYSRYLDKLSPDVALLDAYTQGQDRVISYFSGIPEAQHTFRYATGKWSIKEVLQHLIDTERIFMYRAFRIARADKTPLSNYDQDGYVPTSRADSKSIGNLLREFEATRTASVALLGSLSDDDLARIGISSNYPMSARAAAFIVPGHDLWHLDIIDEKYLGGDHV